MSRPYQYRGERSEWTTYDDERTLPESIRHALEAWPEATIVIELPDHTSRYRWAEGPGGIVSETDLGPKG